MIVIENHYEGKPTILVNDRIINGCQDFTLEEADDILEFYDVSEEEWDEVLFALAHEKHRPMIDFLNHPSEEVREVLAKYGSDTIRDDLMKDPSALVRSVLAKTGTEDQKEVLSKDYSPFIRHCVAKTTKRVATLKHLANDTSFSVGRQALWQLMRHFPEE